MGEDFADFVVFNGLPLERLAAVELIVGRFKWAGVGFEVCFTSQGVRIRDSSDDGYLNLEDLDDEVIKTLGLNNFQGSEWVRLFSDGMSIWIDLDDFEEGDDGACAQVFVEDEVVFSVGFCDPDFENLLFRRFFDISVERGMTVDKQEQEDYDQSLRGE